MSTMKTQPPCTAQRVPQSMGPFLSAFHRAVRGLLDADVSLRLAEDMYAVFEMESAVYALAFLAVGFSRHARMTEITAEEQPRKIGLHITGECRVAGKSLSYGVLLPEGEMCCRLLDDCLTQNRMACVASEQDGRLSLHIVFPRFLADEYNISAVDADDVRNRFYDAMLVLAGEEPKAPMPE